MDENPYEPPRIPGSSHKRRRRIATFIVLALLLAPAGIIAGFVTCVATSYGLEEAMDPPPPGKASPFYLPPAPLLLVGIVFGVVVGLFVTFGLATVGVDRIKARRPDDYVPVSGHSVDSNGERRLTSANVIIPLVAWIVCIALIQLLGIGLCVAVPLGLLGASLAMAAVYVLRR
jgi:amino acid transporter